MFMHQKPVCTSPLTHTCHMHLGDFHVKMLIKIIFYTELIYSTLMSILILTKILYVAVTSPILIAGNSRSIC
jgi:hypothetical protein